MRVVHYLNQFSAGLGGEEAAHTGPRVFDGSVGPGRLLQQLLGAEHEIVATLTCGDDYAASNPAAASELLELAHGADAELLVAGPAFGSGRYGLACARLVAAAVTAGLPAIALMHPDNPGIDDAGGAPIVSAGANARQMRPTLERLAAAIVKTAGGGTLTSEDGRIGRVARLGVLVERSAAARAVDLLLRRLGGDQDATEVPPGGFDTVTAAAPVDKASVATVALLTEGALVPAGNPDRLESARATRWLRYRIDGVDTLAAGMWESVDGGFSTVATNEDPNRLLPVDAARDLEREGAIGRLHGEYLVTVGNGTPVASARRFGVEWAAHLRKAGVQAAILTGT
jgi:glycine reductase